MGISGTAPIIDRIRVLLIEYLDDELALIDTAANALAGSVTEASFTTTVPEDDDIQGYVDRREASTQRITIRDDGRRDRQLQLHGTGTNRPRFDRDHGIIVEVSVTDRGGWGQDGAWRRCDRIAEAVNTVLHRYPQLDVPAQSLAALTSGLDLDSDAGGREYREEDHVRVTRELRYAVRSMQVRN